MAELVGIGSGTLSARINPVGAELWSLTDAAGAEYMTDADPRFWSGHAPVLFPIVGMVRDGRYRLGEREYEMPKHGIARTAQFKVVERDAASATFRLSDSAETRKAYPFAFQLDVTFAVEAMTLRMTATIGNTGDTPMPFSFGFHPAFAWPLPGGAPKADHRIVFDRDEPEPIRRIDPESALLLPDGEPTPVKGNVLAPRSALFEADALIWPAIRSRALRFGAEGGAWLDIAFLDCPSLGLWQKPGAAYLAIEPWAGYNDPAGFAGDFRDKPGVMELAPGHDRAFRMQVGVRPA